MIGILIGIVIFLEAGRLLGKRRLKRADSVGGSPVLEGAVFALLGLLIGFTFSGAASRFDTRRQLIVREANAIGTAYLRIDLLPADAQPKMRDLFRQYLDARLSAYQKIPDFAAAKVELARADALKGEIWTLGVDASRRSETTAATMLLLPALNEMIDITTNRTVAVETHPPAIIWVMLIAVALASSFIAGHGMTDEHKHSWTHIAGFALVMTFAIYVIADLEYPRLGFIRIDAVDHVLVDLRDTMK